jgi:hypothetical protein
MRSSSQRAAAVTVSFRLLKTLQGMGAYKAERKDTERADGVEQHAYAEDIHVLRRHHQIP